MQILQGSVNFLLSLGAAIFVPFIIIVAGLLVRMRVKDAVSAGITLGVAFSGMTMLISYMTAAITLDGVTKRFGTVTAVSTVIGIPKCHAHTKVRNLWKSLVTTIKGCPLLGSG